MSTDEPVKLTQKEIVAFKNMFKEYLNDWFESNDFEVELDEDQLNSLAGSLCVLVCDNIGSANSAAAKYMDWVAKTKAFR